MNKFSVDKDSWHFKWTMYNLYLKNPANYGTRFNAVNVYNTTSPMKIPRDFCSYLRIGFLWPIVNLVISIIMISIMIAVLTASVITGNFVPSLSIIIIMVIMAGLVGIITLLSTLAKTIYNNIINSTSKVKFADDGIISTMYKSYKKNVCPMVDYNVKEKS